MSKMESIEDLMLARLQAAFPDAEVKSGWVETYFPHVEKWPLITLAPSISDQRYDNGGTAGINTASWTVYVIDQVDRTETVITKRLGGYLQTIRKVLVGKQPEERHNNYGGLLQGGPTESAPARFIQPDAGQPYAGLVITITTPHTDKLE